MPPKKRKGQPSAVVVGTVSTRSTRRQSVVNIQIPKSSKGRNEKGSKQTSSPDATSNVESLDVLKQIKGTGQSGVVKAVCSLQSTDSEPDCEDEIIQEKGNQALLQILEDWADDESQEDRKENRETAQQKYYENLEFGAEDINEIIGNSVKKATVENEENPPVSTILIVDTPEVSSTPQEIQEEVIIEEQVEMCDDSIMVECVTEEIVADQQEFIEAEEMDAVVVSVDSRPEVDVEIKAEESVSVNSDQYMQESVILEETSQSVSTTDSNDAEVQKFFTKEIQDSEQKEIPVLDENSGSVMNVEDLPLDDEENKKVGSDKVKRISIEKRNSTDELERTLSDDFPDCRKVNKGESKALESKIAELQLKDKETMEKYGIHEKVAELKLDIEEKEETQLEGEKNENKSGKKKSDKSSRSKIKSQNKVEEKKGQKQAETKKLKSKVKPTKSEKPSVEKKSLDPKVKQQAKSSKDTNKTKKKIPTVSLTAPKTESEMDWKSLEAELDEIEIRRSSRIKSISVLKKKTTRQGLVRSKSEPAFNESDFSDTNSERGATPLASPKISKDRKLGKSTRSAENLSEDSQSNLEFEQIVVERKAEIEVKAKDPVVEDRLKKFIHLKENLYKTDRMTCKEAKKMTCDCFLTSEEIAANEFGCGEDCLNRLLMIECGSLCQIGDRCTNKRFQKGQFAPVDVFNTEKKGLGLRAAANIPYGEFILEYIGEVLDIDEFDKRAEVYSQDKNIHYYFMALRADAIIDATAKGNISRFINHSCDPNAETQKWTVNGELRIGFFSTRTILAGEEITFDYRFQRYGKEAQKCFCEASVCRGWLGEQPDEDSEDEEEEEEEDEEEVVQEVSKLEAKVRDVKKTEAKKDDGKTELESKLAPSTTPVMSRRKSRRRKPRIELFEEIDQLNEEIEMLLTTGLKNQAHTLKLSRLMVRAKEPQQRTKLLRVLRKGELPCRRLFLDYHGLRLMHGYMIDTQHLVLTNKKYESLRLEVLQTLAVLPIPNKTMLQDSKVLPTVEKWASNKDLSSPIDSDSNSPKPDRELCKEDNKPKVDDAKKGNAFPERSVEDQEEEIRFLASKLIEEWSNLKEVFRIPKKERIEQMKEHEREANKKFMQSSYGNDQDRDRKTERYRGVTKYRDYNRRYEKPSPEFIRLSKIERRKLFALQHELKEEERRLKQRELWRQHEVNCLMIGTDPRFTAPFDPSKPYQCIWNPQIGKWQNYPLPENTVFPPQRQPISHMNLPLPQMPKTLPNYNYPTSSLGNSVPQIPSTSMQSVAVSVPQNIAPSIQIPSIPSSTPQIIQPKEEDPSQVKFMGPIPPPVKLPPKWKCAKDKYGRPYYYHIKIRKSQWEPPPLEPPPPPEPDDSSESESSSDTSSVSSDTSMENSDSEDDLDDAKLLLEVRKQMEKTTNLSFKSPVIENVKAEEAILTPSPDNKSIEDIDMDIDLGTPLSTTFPEEDGARPSIDIRLKEQFNFLKDDNLPRKKRRIGLCEEIIISPRTEEDKRQSKEDLKRYKANKEKLKRQKELILQQTRKQLKESEPKRLKEKRPRLSLKEKMKEMDFNSDTAKKIKETFRSNMASTVVGSLNAYRKSDCKEGRITNTEDFKHLARKLTHFVMLKEMKHIARIEDLTCTDNVKVKAREYIRKYMSKFGEVYVKRNDSPDFRD